MPEPTSAAESANAILSSTFFVGVLGTLTSLRTVFAKMNRFELATAIVSGGLMAQFLTPVVTHFLNIDGLSRGVAYAIGLLGLSLLSAIYDTIKQMPAIARSRFGRPNLPEGEM